MRILLIGGTGFIGEYLTKKLSVRKDCELLIAHHNDLPIIEKSVNVCYYRLNSEVSCREMENLANSSDIIVILTQPGKPIIDNIIAANKLAGRLKKIIYLSSLLLYQNRHEKQAENFLIEPISAYENGKREEELKLLQFLKGRDLKLCIARLANVYGDIKNKGIINYLMRAMMNGGEFTINGHGDSVRDYIFIEDAVAWLDFLIFYEQESKIEIFNLCSGQGYSVKELAETAERLIGKTVKTVAGSPVSEKKMIIGDNKKIIGLSGRRLKYDLSQGLMETYKKYCANK